MRLALPEITKFSEIFSEIQLQPTDWGNGKFADEMPEIRGNRMFLNEGFHDDPRSGAIFFGHSGPLGIRMRKSGEFFCYTRGAGTHYGTYCKLTPEILSLLCCDERTAALRYTFRAFHQRDGMVRIVAHYNEHWMQFPRNIAAITAEEFKSGALNMYSYEDYVRIGHIRDQEKLAKSFVSVGGVDVEGAKAAGIRLTYDKY